MLLGNAELDDVVQKYRDTDLYVMAAGQIPPNPSELLGSDPMHALFSKLSQEFDFILVDRPPLVPVIDPVLIDKLTGGMLVVVGANRLEETRPVQRLEVAGDDRRSGVGLRLELRDSEQRCGPVWLLQGSDGDAKARQRQKQ